MISTLISVVVCMCSAFYCGMLHERSKWVDMVMSHADRLHKARQEHLDAVERLPR